MSIQWTNFIERLPTLQSQYLFISTSKARIQLEGLIPNLGNIELMETVIRITNERNEYNTFDIPSMSIQVCCQTHRYIRV